MSEPITPAAGLSRSDVKVDQPPTAMRGARGAARADARDRWRRPTTPSRAAGDQRPPRAAAPSSSASPTSHATRTSAATLPSIRSKVTCDVGVEIDQSPRNALAIDPVQRDAPDSGPGHIQRDDFGQLTVAGHGDRRLQQPFLAASADLRQDDLAAVTDRSARRSAPSPLLDHVLLDRLDRDAALAQPGDAAVDLLPRPLDLQCDQPILPDTLAPRMLVRTANCWPSS